ncbi:MBL fold metallo-hydrolase [Haloferax sp. DFSO52]|uniref:MBL fold metallo-hydrolase n=1 Tax=Haloferax sp. DFSO52 TaxID=3388505 RepID=UPI003A8A0278
MPTNSTIRLLRHATLLVAFENTTFLVDPMLASPGSNPPIQDTPNQRDNPLVPMPAVDLTYDAVVVTHRHTDHFDEAAKGALETDVPLFCQPAEAEAFVEDGFTDVRPIDDVAVFNGIIIYRTPGRHGHGELAERMAPVSGYVFDSDQTLYIAGDTIWYDAVAETLDRFDPDTVVLNAGEARFTHGEPITMGVPDVAAVREATGGQVIAVHMEAINHCLLTRDELRANTENVRIPDDGELLTL